MLYLRDKDIVDLSHDTVEMRYVRKALEEKTDQQKKTEQKHREFGAFVPLMDNRNL